MGKDMGDSSRISFLWPLCGESGVCGLDVMPPKDKTCADQTCEIAYMAGRQTTSRRRMRIVLTICEFCKYEFFGVWGAIIPQHSCLKKGSKRNIKSHFGAFNTLWALVSNWNCSQKNVLEIFFFTKISDFFVVAVWMLGQLGIIFGESRNSRNARKRLETERMWILGHF